MCWPVVLRNLWRKSRTHRGYIPVSKSAKDSRTCFSAGGKYCHRFPLFLSLSDIQAPHHRPSAWDFWKVQSCKVAATLKSYNKCSLSFWCLHNPVRILISCSCSNRKKLSLIFLLTFSYRFLWTQLRRVFRARLIAFRHLIRICIFRRSSHRHLALTWKFSTCSDLFQGTNFAGK